MPELEFSRMLDAWTEIDYLGLDQFAMEHHIQLKHRRIHWPAWNEVLSIALHGTGADVSEIGSTWLPNLVGMDTLRPFSPAEVEQLGRAEAFSAPHWESCKVAGDVRVMAIPWIMDLRAVLYRRDLLRKAGVDEAEAFKTPEQFHDTLARLQAIGVEKPLAMDTSFSSARVLHNIASWLWSGGGDFRTPDGRQLTIQEPVSRAAIIAAYKLHVFLARDPQDESGSEHTANRLFRMGQTAVIITPFGLYHRFKQRRETILPEVAENIGVAALMNIPFIGGCNLVIWRHCLQTEAALELIRYLTGPQCGRLIFDNDVTLPARLSALEELVPPDDPTRPVIWHNLQHGRMVNAAFRWATLEERLIRLFAQLWADIRAHPDLPLEAEIERRLIEFAAQIQRTLLAA